MSAGSLLKSTLLIGSASSVSIVIGIIRAKLLVLMVGPAGVGVMGLFTNIQGVGVALAGLGLQTVGVRELSAMAGRTKAQARVRRLLLGAFLLQSLVLGIGIWVFRAPIATLAFGDALRADAVGLIGIGVAFSIFAAYQFTILKGLRRIRDIAWVTVLGALCSSVAALTTVWMAGTEALIWFVIIQPILSAAVGGLYLLRHPPAETGPGRLAVFARHWGRYAGQGLPFMVTMFMPIASVLVIRAMITRDLGLEAAGFFHAAWTITLQYVGVLLAAMGTDYFPRLAETIRNRPRAIALINDQLQVALALGGPVMIGLVGFAPVVIVLFFSGDFLEAVPVLQWQTLGNIPKIAVWCLGFILVTQGRAVTFFTTELFFNAIFLGFVWIFLPHMGLTAVGIGFLVGYILAALLMQILARRHLGFRWEPTSFSLFVMHLASCAAVLAVAQYSALWAAGLSVVLGGITGVIGLRALIARIGTSHKFIRPIAAVFARLGWPLDKPAP